MPTSNELLDVSECPPIGDSSKETPNAAPASDDTCGSEPTTEDLFFIQEIDVTPADALMTMRS